MSQSRAPRLQVAAAVRPFHARQPAGSTGSWPGCGRDGTYGGLARRSRPVAVLSAAPLGPRQWTRLGRHVADQSHYESAAPGCVGPGHREDMDTRPGGSRTSSTATLRTVRGWPAIRPRNSRAAAPAPRPDPALRTSLRAAAAPPAHPGRYRVFTSPATCQFFAPGCAWPFRRLPTYCGRADDHKVGHLTDKRSEHRLALRVARNATGGEPDGESGEPFGHPGIAVVQPKRGQRSMPWPTQAHTP